MSLFSRKEKKSNNVVDYNPDTMRAILKCSICNGEQVAGFKDIKTGKFTEVMLIKSDKELDAFKKLYGIDSVVKEY